MVVNKLIFKKKNAIIYSIITAVGFFAAFLMVIFMMFDSIKQREKLDTTGRYMVFESKIERLIYSNTTLLQGYEAYIELNPNLEEENAYKYLETLLVNSTEYIKNIGVIQDTTIIWNYPKSDNMAAIGVDLAENENQKQLVLKVKEELVPVLQGPVDLVQGGSGFIVRLPIVRKETGYWGQISIVMKSEKVIQEINQYAEEAGISIAVFNQQNELPFYGDVETVKNSPLFFNIDQSFINWEVYVTPAGGWEDNAIIFIMAILFSGFISAALGYFVYKSLKSTYQLRKSSTQDYLSGLFNRHFLEDYQKNILEEARKEGYNVGFMSLDLNSFKNINDTYGHGVGDQVLIETARLLNNSIKNEEVTFRLGGDEFLVVLPKVKDRIEILQRKDQLHKSFREEFNISCCDIKVLPSIGCSMFPEDGDNIDILLKAADKQMYIEKKHFN